jgi:nucleoid-associated protein YgaU
LAVTPAAQAAPTSTWDRVAQCESGGRWNINTGNGFHGGLQFTPSTWRGFGGAQFAPSAHQASRAEQIVVAERVLAKQGWGAWPVCSRKAGARGQAATVRSAPAKKEATTERVSGPATKRSGGTYVVKRGDTLSRIAARSGVKGGWKTLATKNPGLNPSRLSIGQKISV